MRLLDLFCGAGGAAMGYHRAGFEVVGVDNRLQPNYPFEFHQADALTFPLEGFDAIHASPPCQRWSVGQRLRGREHPDLLTPTRELLLARGGPYVIENVMDAPLRDPLILCGTGFGLPMKRHRGFESNVAMMSPGCAHGRLEAFAHRGGVRRSVSVFGHEFPAEVARAAMEVPWATRDECSQAIPPAYTEHIGHYLAAEIAARKAAAA